MVETIMSYEDIADTINTQNWGVNHAPTESQIIETLSEFSIFKLYVRTAEIMVKFSNEPFSLSQMVKFASLKADGIDIINRNKVRIWWEKANDKN